MADKEADDVRTDKHLVGILFMTGLALVLGAVMSIYPEFYRYIKWEAKLFGKEFAPANGARANSSNLKKPFEGANENCVITEPYKNTTKITPTKAIEYLDLEDSKKLVLLVDNGELQSNRVSDYSGDSTGNKILYVVEGESYPADSNLYRRVVYYDISEGVNYLVYEERVETIEIDNSEYILKITDAAFSSDGKKIAITKNNGLIVHDMVANKTTKVIEEERPNTGGLEVYASYHSPRFSRDDRYILMTVRMWEREGYVLYDTVTSTKKELNYVSFASGQSVIGWYDNKLVVLKYGDSDLLVNGFYYVDPNDLSEEKFINTDGTFFSWPHIIGDHIYYSQTDSERSGYFACNNAGNKHEIYKTISNLYAYNIKTGQKNTILSWDATNASGLNEPYYTLHGIKNISITGEDSVVIKLVHESPGSSNRSYVYYKIVPLEPDTYDVVPVVVDSAAREIVL